MTPRRHHLLSLMLLVACACRDTRELGAGGTSALTLEQRKAYQTEARMLVDLIARSATRKFETEVGNPELLEAGQTDSGEKHKLCSSAIATPAQLPTNGEGVTAEVWEGSSDSGWECLGFAVPHPVHHRFTYVAGGPYLSVKRGGPELSARGFEACAEADFIPGGDTSLYCVRGSTNPLTGEVTLSERPFVIEE